MRILGFIALLFVTTNCVFGQLVEVGDFSYYTANVSLSYLKNRVLYENGGKRYVTSDFITVNEVQEPSPNSYLFEFIAGGQLYFITREPNLANSKYLLTLNEHAFLDTIASFNLSGSIDYRFLYATAKHAYFKLNGGTYRIDLLNGLVEMLTLDLEQYNNYHLTDSGLYLFDDYMLWLDVDSTSPKQGEINFSQTYGYHEFLPHFKRNGGYFFIYQDSLAIENAMRGAYTNGDSVLRTYVLPTWADTSFGSGVMTDLYVARPIFGFIEREREYKNDFQVGALHYASTRYNGSATNYERLYSWLLFDEENHTFSTTTDTTIFSCFRNATELYSLKGGMAAFTFHKNNGFELVGLTKDSAFVIKDIFPGISSFSPHPDYRNYTYLSENGLLFFEADHPIYGSVIYRSDGTKEGTGLLAILPHSKERSSFPIFEHDGVLYIVNNNKLYAINSNTPFKSEMPPNLAKTNFWNQRILREINTQCERWSSTGVAYRPMHAQMKNGQVLMQTNGVQSRRFFLPDAQIAAEESHGSWSTAVAVFDTSGIPLFYTDLSGNSSLAKAALGPNNTMVTAVRHFDESYNGFEAFTYWQDKHIIASYSFSGSKNWQVDLPINFIFINLEADNAGNSYLTGSYSGGVLDLNAAGKLTSAYNGQYFILKINASGDIEWAKNLPMDGFSRHSSQFGYIAFDDDATTLFQLISEGTSNVGSTCNYRSWNSKLSAIDTHNGNIDWTTDLKTSDIAIFTDVTVSEIGDVWVSGGFRGTFTPANGKKIVAKGEADCPTSGILLRYGAKDGNLKSVFTQPNGRYNSITAKNKRLYTAFVSATVEYVGTMSSTSGVVMAVEKRELSGRLLASYKSPVLGNRSFYSIGMKVFPEINQNEDWLLFTYNLNDGVWGGLLSDTLFYPNQNVESRSGNALLMRRPGSIFKSIEADNPVTWGSETYVVYPNPSRHNEVFINAQTGAEPFTAYQLVALDGRIVASGEISVQEWPLYLNFETSVKSGLYILRLTGRNHSKSFKLVFE